MRRTIITVLIVLAGLLGVVAIASASSHGSTVTRARLERALPATFARQYGQQATLLGHRGVTATSLHATAMCDKHGPRVADVGPGSDWVCLMSWQDPNVPMPTEGYGKFEVTVRSNDCFTAGAPSKLVGFPTLTDTKGREVTNPASEFDGCFDPAADNSPTGTSFPSVLAVASTVLSVDRNGSTGVQVTCGTGADGCQGVMEVTDGSRSLGTVHYDLAEEETQSLQVPTRVPDGTTSLDFAFKPETGMAPSSPTSLDISAVAG